MGGEDTGNSTEVLLWAGVVSITGIKVLLQKVG